jgi:hypothetical protein
MQLLVKLPGHDVAQALDDPVLVVTLATFRRRASEFLGVLKHPDPQRLLLQHANELLNAAVGVGRVASVDLQLTESCWLLNKL